MSPWPQVFQSEPGCRKTACDDFAQAPSQSLGDSCNVSESWRRHFVNCKALSEWQESFKDSSLHLRVAVLLSCECQLPRSLYPKNVLETHFLSYAQASQKVSETSMTWADGQVSMVEVVGNDHCATLHFKPFTFKCSRASTENPWACPLPQYWPMQEAGGECGMC